MRSRKMPKLFNIDAEVTPSTVKFGYRVKVWDKELGFYINGMMVYPPNPKYPEWGVMPPGVPRAPGKFVIEFNKKLPLWNEIAEKCIEVAQIEHSNTQDVVITDIPDGPITLEDIPF